MSSPSRSPTPTSLPTHSLQVLPEHQNKGALKMPSDLITLAFPGLFQKGGKTGTIKLKEDITCKICG